MQMLYNSDHYVVVEFDMGDGGSADGEAGLKANKLTATQKEMDFLETRKFNRDQILAMFGVSKSILGLIEDANRANMEAADYNHAKRVIKPSWVVSSARCVAEGCSDATSTRRKFDRRRLASLAREMGAEAIGRQRPDYLAHTTACLVHVRSLGWSPPVVQLHECAIVHRSRSLLATCPSSPAGLRPIGNVAGSSR